MGFIVNQSYLKVLQECPIKKISEFLIKKLLKLWFFLKPKLQKCIVEKENTFDSF